MIRLYLKADPPSKDRVASILAMMHHTLRAKKMTLGVLDVRTGKLFLYESGMDALMPLVECEARSLEIVLSKLS